MGKTWKPDKAPARKRGQKERLERQQSRKAFAEKMERAERLAWAWVNAKNIKAVNTFGLDEKFVKWADEKYRSLKFGEETSKAFKYMKETWHEIVVTAEACAKATAARTYAKRRAQQKHAAEAFRKRRFHERMLSGMDV